MIHCVILNCISSIETIKVSHIAKGAPFFFEAPFAIFYLH